MTVYCYASHPEPGTGTIGRHAQVRPHKSGFTVTVVHNGVGETSRWKKTERFAIAFAASLGFDEVVRP